VPARASSDSSPIHRPQPLTGTGVGSHRLLLSRKAEAKVERFAVTGGFADVADWPTVKLRG